MLARLRQLKTPAEIEILRRLSRIADRAITESYHAVAAGKTAIKEALKFAQQAPKAEPETALDPSAIFAAPPVARTTAGPLEDGPEERNRDPERFLHRIDSSVEVFRVVGRTSPGHHSGLTTFSFIQSFIARVQSAFQSGLLYVSGACPGHQQYMSVVPKRSVSIGVHSCFVDPVQSFS